MNNTYPDNMVHFTAESVNWQLEIDIDPTILDGDDAYMETATQGIEIARKNIQDFQCGSYIEVVKRNKDGTSVPKLVNAYYALINAACYEKAEELRKGYLADEVRNKEKKDLKTEPYILVMEQDSPPSSSNS